jgi:hypothetical protein
MASQAVSALGAVATPAAGIPGAANARSSFAGAGGRGVLAPRRSTFSAAGSSRRPTRSVSVTAAAPEVSAAHSPRPLLVKPGSASVRGNPGCRTTSDPVEVSAVMPRGHVVVECAGCVARRPGGGPCTSHEGFASHRGDMPSRRAPGPAARPNASSSPAKISRRHDSTRRQGTCERICAKGFAACPSSQPHGIV